MKDPPTWSIDGNNIVLLKEKSKIKKGKESYTRNELIIFDVIERKIVFRAETKYTVDSIAWSPDSKSLAVVGYSYHDSLIPPLTWFAALMGLSGHLVYTYYSELFHIAGGEHKEFIILRGSRPNFKISYIVWIE